MSRVRVLIVEDSLTVRAHLRTVLADDPGVEIVGEAADGRSAIELCQQLRPDVMTLDMMLPVMTGVAVTEYIMAHCPTPILIVSASTNRGELFRTYDALAAGAVDVLDKPRGDEHDDAWARTFVATVKLVARVRVITHPRERLRRLGSQQPATPTIPGASRRIVVIGVSTGGPAALVEILRVLPPAFPLPVLVVLHLAELFAQSFADWLDGQTGHRVALAVDGDRVDAVPRRILFAPGEQHMVVRGGRVRLTSDPPRHSCRPSVDTLFESIASEYGPSAVACLLTGMGRDGAAGLLAIRRAGGLTFAQDEASCAVFGMPREAVALGAAMHVLSLDRIAAALAELGATASVGAKP
jgi:two-component system chemotaxis response regulator CheB